MVDFPNYRHDVGALQGHTFKSHMWLKNEVYACSLHFLCQLMKLLHLQRHAKVRHRHRIAINCKSGQMSCCAPDQEKRRYCKAVNDNAAHRESILMQSTVDNTSYVTYSVSSLMRAYMHIDASGVQKFPDGHASTCICCVSCIVSLYMMADYLVPEQAVVHPRFGRPSFLKAQLCSIELLCLTDVSDRKGQMEGLKTRALTSHVWSHRSLHQHTNEAVTKRGTIDYYYTYCGQEMIAAPHP